jgi:putative transposase
MDLTTVIKINLGDPTAHQTQLRKESARLWCRLVKLHKYCRRRRWKWPTQGQLQKHFKGRFDLHSQTVQALIGKFCANIETTKTNRENGDKSARYPWRDKKRFQIVMWKGQSIKRKGNRLTLPNRKGQKRLTIKLPAEFPAGKIVAAELGFRELRLTVKQSLPDIDPAGDGVAAVDLGVIHLGALTDGEDALVIVGRGLRSLVQYKNKALAEYNRLLSKTTKGSRRNRKLRRSKAKMLARSHKQCHNLLHHAASQMIDFCVERDMGTLVYGDCINLSKSARKKKKGSRRSNQMNSGNPLGQLVTYLKYKGAARGVKTVRQEESYTTQTCPKCGHRHKPSGRMYVCRNPDCDFIGIRDLVGAANIKNKHENSGKMVQDAVIPPSQAKYLRPVKTPVIRSNVVVRLTGGKSLGNTHNSVSLAAARGGKTPQKLDLVA